MNIIYKNYEFFPLTILESPLETTRMEIREILDKSWGEKKEWEGSVDLNQINPPPEITPGGAHFFKILLWEPKTNPTSTALFVNLQDAYNSLMYVWNSRFRKKAITVRISNESFCTYPHYEIVVKTVENEERVVYTTFDSKWRFFETGPVQDFENTDYYKRRKIKDRLNDEILNKYMGRLGFGIGTEDFYKSEKNGIYFEQLSWRK